MDKFIMGLLTKFIPDLFKDGVEKFKYEEFKVEEELKIIYKNYLDYEYKKYSQIKTLLYRNEPKNLYDFYEHVDLKGSSGKIIDSINSDNTFRANNKIIITGTGGSGKSLLLRHIFIDQILKLSSIPIFIDLKNVNHESIEGFDIQNYIFTVAKNNHLDIKKSDYFEYTLEKGVYTLIFDGLDEINSSHIDKTQDEIKKLADKFPENRFLISSRPTDQFIGWDNFLEYKILPLTKDKALSLVNKIDYDVIVKNHFYKELDENLFKSHHSFASIPLLLTVMLMTYEDGANIPEDLTEFYNQAFYALYQKHDASKSGYRRELKAKLSAEEFKDCLAYVAMKTFFPSDIVFQIEEMNDYLDKYKDNHDVTFRNQDFLADSTHAACMLFKEGNLIRFSHRSFQEFFAGFGVTKLSDTLQRKILLSWANDNGSKLQSNLTFIETLLSLQRDITFSNLFIPIVEDMEKLYRSHNSNSSKIIPKVFLSFSSRKTKDRRENLGKDVGFTLDDKYRAYFDAQFLIFQNINISIDEIDHDNRENRINNDKLYELISEEDDRVITSEIDNPEIETLVIKFVESWFIPRLEFLIKWKDEFNQRSTTKKRNYQNIIDDL